MVKNAAKDALRGKLLNTGILAHCADWALSYAGNDTPEQHDRAFRVYSRLIRFVEEHLDGDPGDRSWPEILRLAEREDGETL